MLIWGISEPGGLNPQNKTKSEAVGMLKSSLNMYVQICMEDLNEVARILCVRMLCYLILLGI